MSYQHAEAVTSLEDLFLSREFGRPRPVAPARRDAVVRPIRPDITAAAPAGAVLRAYPSRNRAVAAMSGVAAAALVVAGVAAGTGHAPVTGISAQGPQSHPKTSTGPGQGQTPTPSPTPGSVTAPASTFSSATGTVNARTVSTALTPRSPAVVVVVPSGTTVTVVSTPQPVSNAGGGTSPAQPTPPASSNPLTPVVIVVGNAVTTVGNTVTTAGTGLSGTLPAVAPVTTVISNLGGAVSGLGKMLGATIA
jgi:hypothetical protein